MLVDDKLRLDAGTTPSDIAIADFDADGESDIAVVNRGSNNVRVYLSCAH